MSSTCWRAHWDSKNHWYTYYYSKYVFSCFWWSAIFMWPVDTMYEPDIIVGSVSTLWEFTWCYSDHFQPCTIHINIFQCLLAYIWLIAMHSHTIVYPFDVFLTLSDFLQPFVDFIYLPSYQYSDVLIIYNFGQLCYYYRFGLQSLQTISYIWSLQHHFNPSNVTITYILPTTPITYRE
jgi:hypothetical protein